MSLVRFATEPHHQINHITNVQNTEIQLMRLNQDSNKDWDSR